MKRIIKISMVLAVAMLMLTMAIATVHATTDIKKDSGIKIDSKEKVVKVKIIWNGNGGKIGSKKSVTTTVNKGKKIAKFPTTPKKNNYAFKGWWTKKSGGKKISKNTKPTKSVTYYAKWTKKSTSTNSKIVGSWKNYYQNYLVNVVPGITSGGGGGYLVDFEHYYSFYKGGTFKFLKEGGNIWRFYKGKYSVSGNKIYFTDINQYIYDYKTDKLSNQEKKQNIVMEYKISKSGELNIHAMNNFVYDDKTYAPISGAYKFKKQSTDHISSSRKL